MEQLELIFEQVRSLDPTPLLLAVLLGGLIGLEREVHGRPAGLRTHILVCLASTALILVSRRLQADMLEGMPRLVLDPTRLAAGIVTGIGFLGAASVIRAGDIVRGITTGACIWSVSALGVVIGNEAYGLALVTTALVLVTLVMLDHAENWINPIIYRKLVVGGHTDKVSQLVKTVRSELKKEGIKVQDLAAELDGLEKPFELAFNIRCRNSLQAADVLEKLVAVKGVETVRWG